MLKIVDEQELKKQIAIVHSFSISLLIVIVWIEAVPQHFISCIVNLVIFDLYVSILSPLTHMNTVFPQQNLKKLCMLVGFMPMTITPNGD